MRRLLLKGKYNGFIYSKVFISLWKNRLQTYNDGKFSIERTLGYDLSSEWEARLDLNGTLSDSQFDTDFSKGVEMIFPIEKK